MCTGLGQYLFQRLTVRACFRHFGLKRCPDGDIERVVMLRDLRDLEGTFLADYIWVRDSTAFLALNPQAGDEVEFEATVCLRITGLRRDTSRRCQIGVGLACISAVRAAVYPDDTRGVPGGLEKSCTRDHIHLLP